MWNGPLIIGCLFLLGCASAVSVEARPSLRRAVSLCPAGSSNSGVACAVCAAGFYQATPALTVTACTPCPTGMYAAAGSTSCTKCDSGTFAPAGAEICITCPDPSLGSGAVQELHNSASAGCWSTAGGLLKSIPLLWILRRLIPPFGLLAVFTMPEGSTPLSRRTVTVSDQASLGTALSSDATIYLSADIYLTSTITIDGLTDLTINGNGFKVDGRGSVRCFYIVTSEITINNLIITHGKVVFQPPSL